MLEHGLLYMIASDAHSIEHRTFFLKEAYEEIEKIGGNDQVFAMQQMTKDLVNGDQIVKPSYQLVREPRFRFLK